MDSQEKVCRSYESDVRCRCCRIIIPIGEETECSRCMEEHNRKLLQIIGDDHHLLSVGLLDCLPYPGALMWFIILARSITGEITVSQPFLTSQYGYMLCVELVAFNSPGDRRIFLRPIILKGPYDAVNSWPFRESITFKIINRSNPSENKVLTFQTDQGGISRPKNVMRVAATAGVECPDIGQLMRDGFIEDDTLIIVCECHTSDIPIQTRETLPISCDVTS
ncbi:TNF receptor-associated factor 1-like [Lytechinus pictus]|uniref:TNF receptor-associated factor 1-like n=1 Tax=Lytechinus pictus TaxID=7653 RepID=UPI0030B9F4D6